MEDAGLDRAEADVSPRQQLSAEARALRRRSQSISEDSGVIATNDDATESKRSLSIAGYVADPFVELLCWQTVRKDPEINRGYWARVAAVNTVVRHFLQTTHNAGQIVSLGAGFDTLYFQLAADELPPCRAYVEIDFSSVSAKKIHHIMKPAGRKLKALLGDADSISVHKHTDLRCGHYALLGCDLRQAHELADKLALLKDMVDWQAPTLVLAECLFVYMTPAQGDDVIRHFLRLCDQVAFVAYEQVNMGDKFGAVMSSNLHERGIALPGAQCCQSLQTQIDRYRGAGCGHVRAATMNTVYNSDALASGRQRIEKLEMLDETELLEQLLQHYCLVFAVSGDGASPAAEFAPCDAMGL